MVDDTPDLYVSKSSLAEWYRCMYSWYAKYPMGVRALGKDLLPARGSVLHSGILGGILAGAGTYDHACDLAFDDPDAPVVVEAGDDEVFLCQAVLKAATEVFRPLRESDKIVLHEKKLTRDETRRLKKVRYTIKCDAVLDDGNPYVLELKTTKSYINDRYWEKGLIDRQNWFYQDELRNHHGVHIDRLCWQVVKLPTAKMYRYSEMGLSPSDYVDRIAKMLCSNTKKWFPFQDYSYDHDEILKFRSDLDAIIRMQLWGREHGLYPRNTGACFDFQRRCELWPVCHENDTLDNKELYQLRTDRPQRK